MALTTDDTTGTVPGGPLGWGPPLPPRPSRAWWVWAAPPLALVLMLSIGALFVRLPYYVISPGSARQVDDLIKVSAPGQAHPPKGKVLLTTVSLGPVRNVYDAIGGWLDPAVDVVPEREILGPVTDPKQYNQQNIQAMSDSKEVAEYVAFKKLGYQVAVHGDGALVVGVVPGTGAAAALEPGDVIVSADGAPVRLAEDLVASIKKKKPGDRIHLQVRRASDPKGAPREVDVTLSARRDGTPLLGITQQTWRQRFDFPFKVDIDSGQIGGPSAGLAFTLAVLDVLTPGEMTGGVPIAATGTIEPDGSVGPVGGVAQKTIAVERSGAKLFLVPSEEYAIAHARAGRRLRVERCDSIDDALRILATLRGSNALALGSPGGNPAS